MWIKENFNKLLIVLISMIFISGIFILNFDKNSEMLINDSMEQSIKVFAIAKSLNAAISLAQGTEISAAVVTISIGEVLDPINDLVEQFSWVMLASITSLGIQKILLNGVTAQIFNIALIIVIMLLNLWMFLRFKNDEKIRAIFFKTTILMLFLRFAIPVMSICNNYVYNNFVAPDFNIELQSNNVSDSTIKIKNITNDTMEKKEIAKTSSTEENKKTLFNEIVDNANKMINGGKEMINTVFSLDYYEKKVNQYQEVAEKTSDYILALIIAFIFNSIFFPLLFLFMFYKILMNLFNIAKD